MWRWLEFLLLIKYCLCVGYWCATLQWDLALSINEIVPETPDWGLMFPQVFKASGDGQDVLFLL